MNLLISITTKDSNLHERKTCLYFSGASSGPDSPQILLSSL